MTSKVRLGLLVVVPLLAFLWFLDSRRVGPAHLFPIVVDDKVGYITREGKVAIKPQFVSAGEFRDGLAPAKASWPDPWGYIDTRGRWVIKPQFADAQMFSDGLACVDKGGKIGFIDKAGKMVIEPQFRDHSFFQEGRAPAQDSGGSWGFIDPTGKWVVEAKYETVAPFSEGLAVFRPKGAGARYGYLSKDGAVVIAPQYQQARSFHNDVAAVRGDRGWVYINQNNVVWPGGPYGFAGDGSLAFVRNDVGGKGQYRSVGGSGGGTIELEDGRPYVMNMACAKKDGKWGYLLVSGDWSVQPHYLMADDFHEGLALAAPDENTLVYIDTHDKVLYSMKTPMLKFRTTVVGKERSLVLSGHTYGEQ